MKPVNRRAALRMHAICARMRAGACPAGLCEHWIDYTGAQRFENPDTPNLGRCCMVDEAGVSVCVRDPDRFDAPPGEPVRDWFGPGYDEWSFWTYPSEPEYLDWLPWGAHDWDRTDWRAERYQRRKAWKRRAPSDRAGARGVFAP